MNALGFLWNYVRWHYTMALVDLYFILRNYLWGIGHIFSVPILLRTLFVPWRRLGSHTATFMQSPGEFLGDVLVNVTMRLFGFVMRIALLLCALFAIVFIVLLFLATYICWILLPIMLLSLVISAFSLLLS